jgi:hypothetical protein
MRRLFVALASAVSVVALTHVGSAADPGVHPLSLARDSLKGETCPFKPPPLEDSNVV